MKGRRIIIEGMDGTGKSTLAKALSEKLNAHLVAMPSHDGEAGKLIRRCFTGEAKLDDRAMLPLFVADAVDREPVLIQMQTEKDVVLDRHTMVSAWAYQMEHHTVSRVDAMTQPEAFGTPFVIFILDLEPEAALERQRARTGKAVDVLYEKDDLEYVSRLRQRYIAYAMMHERSMILDASYSTEELVDVILDALQKIAEVEVLP